MNPLRGLLIINPTLKNDTAKILNHGFGQRAALVPLPCVTSPWNTGWLSREGLECVLIHNALPVPRYSAPGILPRVLCVLGDFTEPAGNMGYGLV